MTSMDEKKQIAEIAKLLCEEFNTKKCNIICNGYSTCDVYFYAERIYSILDELVAIRKKYTDDKGARK